MCSTSWLQRRVWRPCRFEWTSGWNETTDRKAGYFVGRSAVPETLDDVILQGPHLAVANALRADSPIRPCEVIKDYTRVGPGSAGTTGRFRARTTSVPSRMRSTLRVIRIGMATG